MNIHILPTNKPSRLVKFKDEPSLLLSSLPSVKGEKFNIYITSDEEIKEVDIPCWVISDIKTAMPHKLKDYQYRKLYTYKKIILTTDGDLIKDGVQTIDEKFLEWFVKNPSCERVEIDFLQLHKLTGEIGDRKYKIIIPKKELKTNLGKLAFTELAFPGWSFLMSEKSTNIPALPGVKEISETKQETLEEAAKEFVLSHDFSAITTQNHLANRCFQLGAKWQAEIMYSEEEVEKLLICCKVDVYKFRHRSDSGLEDYTYDEKVKEWFKQNKKK